MAIGELDELRAFISDLQAWSALDLRNVPLDAFITQLNKQVVNKFTGWFTYLNRKSLRNPDHEIINYLSEQKQRQTTKRRHQASGEADPILQPDEAGFVLTSLSEALNNVESKRLERRFSKMLKNVKKKWLSQLLILFRDQVRVLAERVSEFQRRLDELSQEMRVLRNEAEQARASKLDAERARDMALKQSTDNARAVAENSNTILELSAEKERLGKEILTLQTSIETREASIRQLSQQLGRLQDDYDDLLSRYGRLDERREAAVTESKHQLDELRESLKDAVQEQSALSLALAGMEGERNALQAHIDGMGHQDHAEVARLDAALAQAIQERETFSTEYKSLQTHTREATQRAQTARERYNGILLERQGLTNEIARLQEKLATFEDEGVENAAVPEELEREQDVEYLRRRIAVLTQLRGRQDAEKQRLNTSISDLEQEQFQLQRLLIPLTTDEEPSSDDVSLAEKIARLVREIQQLRSVGVTQVMPPLPFVQRGGAWPSPPPVPAPPPEDDDDDDYDNDSGRVTTTSTGSNSGGIPRKVTTTTTTTTPGDRGGLLAQIQGFNRAGLRGRAEAAPASPANAAAPDPDAAGPSNPAAQRPPSAGGMADFIGDLSAVLQGRRHRVRSEEEQEEEEQSQGLPRSASQETIWETGGENNPPPPPPPPPGLNLG